MTTLQDILGLITKRKIKTPSDNDYIISAAYSDTQEVLKPQPKMEASLLNIGALKKYVLASIAPPTYKVYTALLTQTGTNPPVATVLENTIGDIWFSYFEAGVYYLHSDNLFPLNKTWNTRCIDIGTGGSQNRATLVNNENLISMEILTESNVDTPSNDILSNVPIEIRVYN